MAATGAGAGRPRSIVASSSLFCVTRIRITNVEAQALARQEPEPCAGHLPVQLKQRCAAAQISWQVALPAQLDGRHGVPAGVVEPATAGGWFNPWITENLSQG